MIDDFQREIQARVQNRESVLLVAPTGLGKTLAVTGDIENHPCKTVYGVPLRALGGGIKKEVSKLRRGGRPISPVIHHGDLQESVLFGEEFIITTYDQIVCGVPGLPLSLPLRAGHAVAGALLMSRLVLDETHLAWGISEHALPILLGIVEFRRRFRRQTVLVTATLPSAIADALHALFDHVAVLGVGEYADDKGLKLRDYNRKVVIRRVRLPQRDKPGAKALKYSALDGKLSIGPGKRIYFANTVERLQETYDRLVAGGLSAEAITVLHNRMPQSQRRRAESQAMDRFGKDSSGGDWLLLTNQVAEAGLDISAPLVISDPAPVDTLVQRAGRCARWFRDGRTEGIFDVVDVPAGHLRGWSVPYRERLVLSALKKIPLNGVLNWEAERNWVDAAWGVGEKSKDPTREQRGQIETAMAQASFALNLFDRASQRRRPGDIASVFREILSVEVAVDDADSPLVLENLLNAGERPETSSVSLGQARALSQQGGRRARVVRYEEGDLVVRGAADLQPGDILVVPSSVAYLHRSKGLCFGDGTRLRRNDLLSRWEKVPVMGVLPLEGGRCQTLLKHTERVMDGTIARLGEQGEYRRALVEILQALEPGKGLELADAIAEIATVAAAFHDIGKAGQRWQDRAREIDPECSDELIGRTGVLGRGGMKVAHTPPGYAATVKACEVLMGPLNSAEPLVRMIALAAARHHSSFMNPAASHYTFDPHPLADGFVRVLLKKLGAERPDEAAAQILGAAQCRPGAGQVPLALPNVDLFPVYALVGRAVMLADREDASGHPLEDWETQS